MNTKNIKINDLIRLNSAYSYKIYISSIGIEINELIAQTIPDTLDICKEYTYKVRNTVDLQNMVNIQLAGICPHNIDFINVTKLPKAMKILSDLDFMSLSPRLTEECMRWDCEILGNKSVFTSWANGGRCPYSWSKNIRAIKFTEKRSHYTNGKPKMSIPDLVDEIFKYKKIRFFDSEGKRLYFNDLRNK